MIVVLIEIISANSLLRLDFKGTIRCACTGGVVDSAHYIHVVNEAKDCRIKGNMNQLL